MWSYLGMTATDELLKNNDAYASTFTKGGLPLPPAKKVAVVACMDARLDVARALGLEEGDAHVIRNAGGIVTEDEIRSLAISQRLLGTEEIILIHHTDCGMLTFTDDAFKQQILEETGQKPGGRPSRSPTSTPTCSRTSPASRPARSSPRRTTFGASSTRSRRAGSARSASSAGAGRHPVGGRRGPVLVCGRARRARVGVGAEGAALLGHLQVGLAGGTDRFAQLGVVSHAPQPRARRDHWCAAGRLP